MAAMINHAVPRLAIWTVATTLLTSCASSTATPGGAPSGGGAAPSAASTPALPATTSATTPSRSPSGECATGTYATTVRPGEILQPVCLRIGARLRIDTPPSPQQPWQPPTTSDGQVLTCDSTQGKDGTATATCRALRPGSATVTTTTAPFAGDPHGPPQHQWQLTVQVRA